MKSPQNQVRVWERDNPSANIVHKTPECPPPLPPTYPDLSLWPGLTLTPTRLTSEKGKVKEGYSPSPNHAHKRRGRSDPLPAFSNFYYDRHPHVYPPFTFLALRGFLPLSLYLIHYKTSTSIIMSSPWAHWKRMVNKGPRVPKSFIDRCLENSTAIRSTDYKATVHQVGEERYPFNSLFSKMKQRWEYDEDKDPAFTEYSSHVGTWDQFWCYRIFKRCYEAGIPSSPLYQWGK